MKIVRNKYFPIQGYKAINLFGILFVKQNARLSDIDINHEAIHSEQRREVLWIFYGLWYVIEYLIRLICYRSFDKAYKNLLFEQEAYEHQDDLNYIDYRRKPYAWIRKKAAK